jgi:hypothetical protein
MTNDPIVEEVHRIREKMWDECGGDLDRLMASFRAGEAEHPERVFSGERLKQLRREDEQATTAESPKHCAG